VIDAISDDYATLTDERQFKAKVVGADARTNVALLKIDNKNLLLLSMGDSYKIKVGE